MMGEDICDDGILKIFVIMMITSEHKMWMVSIRNNYLFGGGLDEELDGIYGHSLWNGGFLKRGYPHSASIDGISRSSSYWGSTISGKTHIQIHYEITGT